MHTVRILHTADWHLGRELAGIDRSRDFERFLDWLLDLVRARSIDVILLAGDVFNTSMPSNAAQRLYYEFVRRASETNLLAVVVIAGNHDSAYFLGAARSLLEGCRTYVAGSVPEEQALLIRDPKGRVVLAVAAVPYLREGDVVLETTSAADWDEPAVWREGVRRYYDRVSEELDRLLAAEGLAPDAVPRVAMGHLFVTGEGTSSKISEADAHYVGSLRNIGLDAVGPNWSYAAFGHVHEPREIKGSVPAWYSGAPLLLRFADRNESPSVIGVTMCGKPPEHVVEIERIDVPQPRKILSLAGNEAELASKLEDLKKEASGEALAPMAELVYTGSEPPGAALLERLSRRAEAAGVLLGPVRIGGEVRLRAAEEESAACITLEDITPDEVFRSVLDAREISDESRPPLLRCFAEALEEVERERRVEDERLLRVLSGEAESDPRNADADENGMCVARTED